MAVRGHEVLFECELAWKPHCVGEDSDAVAPQVGTVEKFHDDAR